MQADYQAGEKMLTLWSATQIPHILRSRIACSSRCPRTVSASSRSDVGGGFGGKLNVYREELLLPFLAMRLNRPVKWIEIRRENLQTMIHGRDQINYVELALAKDGRMSG